MFNDDNNMVMPVAPTNFGGGSNGMFGNEGWWIILLFILLGYGNNGWGNNQLLKRIRNLYDHSII